MLCKLPQDLKEAGLPQKEKILWDALSLMYKQDVTVTTTYMGEEPKKKVVKNAIGVVDLKGRLVLKYIPADIEDTIYLLKNRDYLITEKTGNGGYDFVYSLTDKAIKVASSQKLPTDEEVAFKEALWDINPGIWGVRLNVAEMFRRGKKKLKK